MLLFYGTRGLLAWVTAQQGPRNMCAKRGRAGVS